MTKYVLALLAAFAASTAPAFAGNACSLLNKAEATKFLGTPVASVKAESDGCRYLNASKNQNVYITVDASGDGALQMASLKGHAQPVGGLGTTAYFVVGTLFAQKGRTMFSVSIIKNEDSVQKMEPQLTSLARLVLSRI